MHEISGEGQRSLEMVLTIVQRRFLSESQVPHG